MSKSFPHLFSEIALGPTLLANRIVSTGHHTYLSDAVPDERLIAYHEARAKGGAGLIVAEIVAVHETAGFSRNLLKAASRDVIPAYRALAEACHRHGTRIFAQLFHPGREILSSWSGMLPVAWAPSAVPNERFHIMPKPLSTDLIADIVKGYGRAAAHLAEAGFDGVEIVASHGYLPAQFLNPRLNLRTDAYGGDGARRQRFLRETFIEIRKAAPELTVGLRISGSEMDSDGLNEAEVLEACQALGDQTDYVSVVAGTSASLGGSQHIVPPMGLAHGYVAPFAKAIKSATAKPVIVTGRINQPQIAEQIIAKGEADLCGMTRALICDPEMANKARDGDLDDIRACIGCNQACIGRAHKGLGISCIQYPESGRELDFAAQPAVGSRKRILIAGGGPAGLKAAAVTALRGHEVTLYERHGQFGGQARLAQRLPGREEFGGIIANLEREARKAGARLVAKTAVNAELVRESGPDGVIVATGALPYVPALQGLGTPQVVTAWDLLEGRAKIGARVAIADWRADWIGLGLAERLASEGSAVSLMVNAAMAGESLQIYTRNHYLGRLHRLGVSITTHARLFGSDGSSVYFQDTLSEEPIVLDAIDSLVLALGHQTDERLERALAGSGYALHAIGDCVTPRTAEEAVFEGLQVGWTI